MLAAVDMFLRFPPPRQVPAVTNDRAGTCLSPSYERMAGIGGSSNYSVPNRTTSLGGLAFAAPRLMLASKYSG